MNQFVTHASGPLQIARARLGRLTSDSLYRNSACMLLSTALMAVFGFVYWLMAARWYSPHEVGLAATAVSAMTYVAILSQLGLNVGIIRYLPKASDPSATVTASLLIVAAAGVAGSIVALLILRPQMQTWAIGSSRLLVATTAIPFMASGSLINLTESVFVAWRRGSFVLARNTVVSIAKVAFAAATTSYGAYGLFSSWALANAMGLGTSLLLLSRRLQYRPRLAKPESPLKEMAGYSLGNYVATLLASLPASGLPVVMTALLGAETTAYYHIAMTYAALLDAIPVAICHSLFAEGAHAERPVLAEALKAVKLMAVVLLPAVFVLLTWGDSLLQLFGSNYSAQSSVLLRMLSLSSLFVAVNTVCWTLLNLRRQIGSIICVLAFSCASVFGLSLLWSSRGLSGFGQAWLVSQALTSVVYVMVTADHYRTCSTAGGRR